MAALHAFLMLLPLSAALDAWRIQRRPLSRDKTLRVLRWLLLNGGCSYVNQYSGLCARVASRATTATHQQALGPLSLCPRVLGDGAPRILARSRVRVAAVLDAMSSPLSHALANVMKRATVITAAMVYQARPVTALHVCGVALSVFGAVGYQHLDLCDSGAKAGARGGAPSGDERYEHVPLARRDSDGHKAHGGSHHHRGECDTVVAGDISNSSSSPPDSPPSTPQAMPSTPRAGRGLLSFSLT